jgi:conjugal transfer pilus assembly protein TraB
MNKNDFIASIKSKWDALDSLTKRKYVIIGTLATFIGGTTIYYASKPPKQEVAEVQKKEIPKAAVPITLDPDLTKKDFMSRMEEQMSQFNAELQNIKANSISRTEAEEMAQTQKPIADPLPASDLKLEDIKAPPPVSQAADVEIKRPEKKESYFTNLGRTPSNNNASEQGGPLFVGAISHIEVPVTKEDDAEKKSSNKVYLPPSIIPAKVLTGVKAHTIKGAEKDPLQILLRIQAPAILPNEVRAQLKGCFVIADAYGRLDTKRIEVRPVSLSCLDKGGKSVIDEEITGFVVDKDGSVGLSGHVYSHMSESVGYAFLASVIGGIGRDYQMQNTEIITSTTGTLTTYDPDRSLRAGLAAGVGDGSDELKKIYLDIVKQAAPVIESGSMKDVDIIISKGKSLTIKETEG